MKRIALILKKNKKPMLNKSSMLCEVQRVIQPHFSIATLPIRL